MLLWGYFEDVAHSDNQLTLSKGGYPQSSMWASSKVFERWTGFSWGRSPTGAPPVSCWFWFSGRTWFVLTHFSSRGRKEQLSIFPSGCMKGLPPSQGGILESHDKKAAKKRKRGLCPLPWRCTCSPLSVRLFHSCCPAVGPEELLNTSVFPCLGTTRCIN